MRMIVKMLAPMMLLIGAWNAVALPERSASIPPEEKHYIVTENLKSIHALLASAEIQQCFAERQHHLLRLIDILKIDQQWPNQEKYLLQVVKHPCAQLLQAKLNEPHNQFSEFMLTDELGALIAATPIPSDYWQADEQKFIQPAVTGKNYISEEGWDASTGTFSFFISVPVQHDNKFVGVLISGINVTSEYLNKLSLRELLRIEVEPESQNQ